jgi:hypothetical protein
MTKIGTGKVLFIDLQVAVTTPHVIANVLVSLFSKGFGT